MSEPLQLIPLSVPVVVLPQKESPSVLKRWCLPNRILLITEGTEGRRE